MKFYPALCGLLLIVGLPACEPDYYEEPIPVVPVDFTINLSDPSFFNLHSQGYVSLNEGIRGIILYKSGSVYRAFERNCTFQPNSACATVTVHPSGQYMHDSCCGSTFDFGGNPIGGPAYRPLYQYQTQISGSFLRIFNDL